jgi:uncharacterized iron-regulated membrane protein
LIHRIHAYAGLVTYVNLMLYAVVGIAALFDARTPRAAPPALVWEQPFAVLPGESDRAVAERVVRLLGLSLATPVHDFAIGHDSERHLVLDLYHANGRHVATVLGRPGRLRVSETRASLARYLNTLHVTTAAFHSGDGRMCLWAWWNEFAMWCLGVMAVSGVWIWWRRRGTPLSADGSGTARRVHRYAALGALGPLVVYEISAIGMAHRAWMQAGAGLGAVSGTVIGALSRIHRMRGAGLAPLLGAALLVLGATGLWLWWKARRGRRVGAVLLSAGILFAGGLICWMRIAPGF